MMQKVNAKYNKNGIKNEDDKTYQMESDSQPKLVSGVECHYLVYNYMTCITHPKTNIMQHIGQHFLHKSIICIVLVYIHM